MRPPRSTSTFPRWISPPDAMNLREVAPGLFVGDCSSPLKDGWHTIVDLYGQGPFYVRPSYDNANVVLRIPFNDGATFPRGALSAIWTAWQMADVERGKTLIHCQAGLSRSASAAYALIRKRYGLPHEDALSRVEVPPHEGEYPMHVTLRSARAWVKDPKRG